MKRLKKFILTITLSTVVLVPFVTSPALATTNLENQQDINVPSNINELSTKFHVKADELRAEIKKEANSPVFSPFSAIKADYGVKASTSVSKTAPKLNFASKSKTDQISILSSNSTWYNQYNQNTTAYLSTGYKTASGVWPAIGMCAVHHYSNGTPYIPFGTFLYYDSLIHIQGSAYWEFNVQDTGDPKFVQSSYWADIYFGDNNSANRTAALNFGNQLMNYMYYK